MSMYFLLKEEAGTGDWTVWTALTFLWLSDREQVSLPGGELCEASFHLLPYSLETADEGRLGMENQNPIRNKELF